MATATEIIAEARTGCTRPSTTSGRSSAGSAPAGRRRRSSRSCAVDYYGCEVPLQQLAGFSVPEPRVLVVQPYDKGAVGAIEKAIQQSDLGINPSNDGQVIRLTFPELTEERRKELVKVVKHQAEEGRGRGPQRPPPCPPRAGGAREGRRDLPGRARPHREGPREGPPTRSSPRSTSCSPTRSRSSSRSDRGPGCEPGPRGSIGLGCARTLGHHGGSAAVTDRHDEDSETRERPAARPATEGVRIIGADEAQAAIDSGAAGRRLPESEPRFGRRARAAGSVAQPPS